MHVRMFAETESKPDLPLSPPKQPVGSVETEQTGGSRLLCGLQTRLLGPPKTDDDLATERLEEEFREGIL